MTVRRKMAAALGAAALTMQPQLAVAQEAVCISEAEVGAMVTYSMPSAIEAVRTRCAPELPGGGFLATGSQVLAANYEALQPTAWPQAKSGLLKIAGSKTQGEDDPLAMIATLPDHAIQPFIDALIVQELAEQIPTEDCGKIERVMEAVAPIEPEIASTLVGVIFSLVKPEDPAVCPA